MKLLERSFIFCHFWKPSGWWILRGTLRAHTLTTQGISNTIINVNDLKALEAAIRPNTKVIYAETFGNPNSDVTNLEAIAEIAHKHNILFIVDNTFAPIIQGAEAGTGAVL